MYKMIIVDLDGTLLNDAKEASKENIKAIKRAYEEKGVISVIATGRPLEFANDICNIYGNCFGNYIIACNGAIIKDIEKDEYIQKITFTNDEILNFRSMYIEENADYMILATEKRQLVETRNSEGLNNAGISVVEKKIEVDNIADEIIQNENGANLGCLIGGEISSLERISREISKIENIEKPVISGYLYKNGENIFKSKYIDILKKGCNKKNGIEILAQKLGIRQEEIIVMGDRRK